RVSGTKRPAAASKRRIHAEQVATTESPSAKNLIRSVGGGGGTPCAAPNTCTGASPFRPARKSARQICPPAVAAQTQPSPGSKIVSTLPRNDGTRNGSRQPLPSGSNTSNPCASPA